MNLFYKTALFLSRHRLSLNSSSLKYKISMKISGLFIKTAVFCLPFFYRVTNGRKFSFASPSDTEAPVLSLTSYPARIPYIWVTISSLLRQTVRPKCIVLWLSREQFPGERKDLPQSLLSLEKDGFFIRFVDGDIRSHKKYFYAFKEFPESNVIVVDDDVIYPSDTVQQLMSLHKRHPNTVCCLIGHEIMHDENKDALPYLSWKANPYGEMKGQNICPIGLGGVLYPPHSYADEIFDKDVFTDICKFADDLWLKLMCHKKGTVAVKAMYRIPGFPVRGSQETSLFSINVQQDDLNTMQWKAVANKYNITYKGE